MSRWFQLRPEHCQDNRFTLAGNAFTLHTRSGLTAGVGAAGAVHAQADARQWASCQGLLDCAGRQADLPVVVGYAALVPGRPAFFLLRRVGAGEPAAPSPTEDLSKVFNDAETYRQTLAGRLVVDTPDAFVNAAAGALCAAADGVWDEPSGVVLHGAVAWRSKLLGWRGPYLNDALGWHDRARRHITYWAGRQNTSAIPDLPPRADAAANLSRSEAALHSNGDLSNSHYDMNLVYMDMVFRHLLWTGDLDLARQLWPVIERHLAWERRLFRRPYGPQGLPLYEGYACIWASDDVATRGAVPRALLPTTIGTTEWQAGSPA